MLSVSVCEILPLCFNHRSSTALGDSMGLGSQTGKEWKGCGLFSEDLPESQRRWLHLTALTCWLMPFCIMDGGNQLT